MRSVLEAIDELGADRSARSRVFGIGCYTAFSNNLDVEVLQALHGRAPSLATGVKRAKPDTHRVHHPGRRRHGQRGPAGGASTPPPGARTITCFMLNNGVFGETGGHMTATTVLGQRTKNTLDGRDAEAPRLPDPAEQPHRRARRRGLRRARRGEQRRQRRPHEADDRAGVRDAAARARASRSSRSSPCARPAGSSRPRRRPTT